jgi:uncharacterized membrane protein YkvA (DUF1232 family)
MKFFDRLKARANALKKDIIAISLSLKDKRTPWYAKAMIVLTISYALSPIDLIPDFIPILGYLDDLIILPILIIASIKLIPKDVFIDCQIKAQENLKLDKSKSWIAAVVFILIWLGIIALIIAKIHNKSIYK